MSARIGVVALFVIGVCIALSAWELTKAQESKGRAGGWEIAKVSAELRMGATEDESWNKAKEMAAEGWELVAVTRSASGQSIYYLKRPK